MDRKTLRVLEIATKLKRKAAVGKLIREAMEKAKAHPAGCNNEPISVSASSKNYTVPQPMPDLLTQVNPTYGGMIEDSSPNIII